jgi:hypothetical protein
MMRRQVEDPNIVAWMEPHGEFWLANTTPAGQPPFYANRYPAYLQLVKGYSLQTLGQAHAADPHAYASWADLPYPDEAYFSGRRGQFVDLDDVQWRWKPGALEDGEKANWHQPDTDDAAWTQSYRQDKRLLSQWSESLVWPLWYRFEHEVPESLLQPGKPVYLHVMPMTEKAGSNVTVWVNGQEVGRQLRDPSWWWTLHVQADVTKHLRPGTNHFAIYSHGGRIAYRVFLSNTPGESFPYKDPHLNRQYLDWKDYLIWEKFQTLTRYLQVMRAVDPNRPIKVMTPHLFQSEAMDLLERYGAYPQLTGEGSWYRPMHYKGYAHLRGLPASSEGGGRCANARETQNMFANIFWESQDCHDYVFDLARDLWPFKDNLQWWSQNKALLATLGKIDLARPALGELRDVRMDQRYRTQGEIWNWDLARGALPAMGLTPVLVDGRDMEKGLADDLPVILDCATTVMDQPMVQAIERYVAQGGTFVAQHHTGRHTPERPDAWPLARAFGYRVQPRLMSEGNVHQWPLGKIRFTPEQNLLPSLKGQEFDGTGVSIDYQGKEYSGAIALAGDGERFVPIARWSSDDAVAIAEIRHGKGRLIVLGSPFYLRFRDVQGKWLNDQDRQDLLAEMLASLGVRRQTAASDARIWLERRESKNGLYDVYLAAAMGVKDKDWKLEDRWNSDLSAGRASAAPVIEASAAGAPDVPAEFEQGQLRLRQVSFAPYQVRQFAVLREDAGFHAPLHWLAVQRKAWRALDPVPPALAEESLAAIEAIAGERGEAGLDISQDWLVRRDPPDAKETSWISGQPGEGWIQGAMGSWLSQGWEESTLVQYRKTVQVPPQWREGDSRVVLGVSAFYLLGVRERGRLWVNGQAMGPDGSLFGTFQVDVSEAAKTGALDLALEVQSQALDRGPIGTMYLRKLPAPSQRLELSEGWRVLEGWEGDWQTQGREVNLPLKGPVFALKKTVHIPADWAGRPVRLVVEQGSLDLQSTVGGAIINHDGYFRSSGWSPVGPRLDRWLKPGQDNDIVLLGQSHLELPTYKGFNADIRAIRLEVGPAPGEHPAP